MSKYLDITRELHISCLRQQIVETTVLGYDDVSTDELKTKFEPFFCNKTLYSILSQYVFGVLIPGLSEVDDIRYRYKLCKYYTMDACESDIRHKWGIGEGTTKNQLNASSNRIGDEYNMTFGSAKLLEKCGESYKKTYDQQMGGSIIARNMRLCENSDGNIHLVLSTDVATESNPDNVRDAICNGIKQELGVKLHEDVWYNPQTDIEYRFDTMNVNVK